MKYCKKRLYLIFNFKNSSLLCKICGFIYLTIYLLAFPLGQLELSVVIINCFWTSIDSFLVAFYKFLS